MPRPQPGIFADGSRYHHYLEYDLSAPTDMAGLSDALEPIIALDGDTVHVIIAFGADLWRKLNPGSTPDNLQPFRPVGTGERSALATQRDLFVWIHAADQADTLDAAMAAHALLKNVGTVRLSLPAFIYRDSRDLIGFVDGTANPKDDARFDAALVPEGQTGAGGAHVFSQKWVHDLPAFHGLEIEDQERVVGRTKIDDIELEGSAGQMSKSMVSHKRFSAGAPPTATPRSTVCIFSLSHATQPASRFSWTACTAFRATACTTG